MNYSLTEFTSKELHTLIKANKELINDRNKDLDSINEVFEEGETKTLLLNKRNEQINTFTQFQVMLLTALQEVKQRETIQQS